MESAALLRARWPGSRLAVTTACLSRPLDHRSGARCSFQSWTKWLDTTAGRIRLATNRWAGGVVDPNGYLHIEHFCLEGAIPVWRFSCADALLEKSVWMQQGANTTYIQYKLVRASRALDLTVKAFVNYRDYHSTTQAGRQAHESARRLSRNSGTTRGLILHWPRHSAGKKKTAP
jgi:hypothetical protein